MKQYQEEFEHMQADLHSIPRDEMRARYDNLEKLTGERYPRGSPRHIEFLEYVIRKLTRERVIDLKTGVAYEVLHKSDKRVSIMDVNTQDIVHVHPVSYFRSNFIQEN